MTAHVACLWLALFAADAERVRDAGFVQRHLHRFPPVEATKAALELSERNRDYIDMQARIYPCLAGRLDCWREQNRQAQQPWLQLRWAQEEAEVADKARHLRELRHTLPEADWWSGRMPCVVPAGMWWRED